MSAPPTLPFLLGILSLVSTGSALHAQEHWPGFRGPDGCAAASAREIPVSFTLEEVAWKVELPGEGHSSPVVWGERVFVTTSDPETRERALVCLSTKDGRELWSRVEEVEPYTSHELNSIASSTPAVDAERVYVSQVNGSEREVAAFSHAGELAWTRKLGPFEARHGGGSSPVLVDGVLVVANDNESETSALFGLDPATGKERWRRERESQRAAFATPAVYRSGSGAQVLFASTAHGITCLDAATGELAWEESGVFDFRCVSSPVVAGGVVFATAGRGGGGEESAAVLLAQPEPEASRVAYQVRRALPYVPTPVAHAGRLYIVSDGGIASCVDAKTGEELWRERIRGEFFGSPIRVDDRLYVVNKAGDLIVLAAADEFEVLALVELGESSYATPAVAGGVLYLRTLRHLIAVGGQTD